MKLAKGVSGKQLGSGKWKLRWRDELGGNRGHTTEGPVTESEARALAAEVALAVERHGFWVAEKSEMLVGQAPPANLLDGMEAFIAAREASGRYRPRTAQTFRSYRLRLAERLYSIEKIPEDQPLPVTVLTRSNFEALMRVDKVTEAADSTSYGSIRLLLDAWRWMADSPMEWPHVPEPPRSPKDYLPRTAKYSRTVAPTLAEVDACLRHLPQRTRFETRMLGVFVRFTGLRSSTVLAIRRDHLDLDRALLYIPREEDKEAFEREVPLAPALIEEARDWVEVVPEGLLFRKRRHSTTDRATPSKASTETFNAAWRAATDAGEVDQRVWQPRGRKFARPVHAFRAAFDAHLKATRQVEEDVIDFLVGRGEGVRMRHYGRDMEDEARAAVALLTPIDWEGPPDNVLAMGRAG